MPPQISGWGLDFDDVRAEVGQNHRGAWPGDEARKVHHLQTGEDLVRRVFCRHETLYLPLERVSWGRPGSPCVEVGGALLQERSCALPLVFRSGTESEERRFE